MVVVVVVLLVTARLVQVNDPSRFRQCRPLAQLSNFKAHSSISTQDPDEESSSKPFLHRHSCPPYVLMQFWNWSHKWLPSRHSSISSQMDPPELSLVPSWHILGVNFGKVLIFDLQLYAPGRLMHTSVRLHTSSELSSHSSISSQMPVALLTLKPGAHRLETWSWQKKPP